ncbi:MULTISPECIES: hypothetical protein [Shewanella]|jgi:hypothetical protein|uniref:hypothetical protein n=1 Tax=Shewanella TaxID=22 RepID=UPI003AAE6D85
MKHCLDVVCIVCALIFSTCCYAGTIVVRKSSEPFDAFAVRDDVLQHHQWQQITRQQQQLIILQALPLDCIAVDAAYLYFHCGQQYYRPYQYQDQQLFIQIDPHQPSSVLPE